MVDLEKPYLNHDFSVLIADDQKLMLKNLERYFSKYFNILTASSFEEGKSHLSRSNIGVLVSDHQMAEGQGLELLEYVRDNYNHIRRIVITADRHEQVVIDMMRNDLAVSFVFKPIIKSQLHLAVAEQSEIYLQQ